MHKSFNRLPSETSFKREDNEATSFDSLLDDEQQLYEPMFILYKQWSLKSNWLFRMSDYKDKPLPKPLILSL